MVIVEVPQVDLGNKVAREGYDVEPEEHADDRKLRLHKERVLFWFCLLAVAGALLACGYALVFAGLSSDDKRSVFSVLTLILGGIVGYFLKK